MKMPRQDLRILPLLPSGEGWDEGIKKEEFLIFQSPHPNPLHGGEGIESYFA